jgi:type IX secretion system PorP/SprF family membrane protein
MFNRTTYNPASTGASRYVNIYGHWREQWQGFGREAPQTMFLTAHSYFPDLKSGMGIIALNDKLGIERNMQFKLSYAYHVHLTSNSYISLGLSAGVLNRSIDWPNAKPAEYDPTTIRDLAENKWTADFDFGVEYNMERFTGGISLTHLSRTADRATHTDMGHHFYGYLKYRFPINFNFDIVPSLFAQNNKKSTHIELNTVLFYRSKAWAGISYRVDENFSSESVVGILGIEVMDMLRISYSFDYNIGKIGLYANNTHEVMLGVRLSRPQKVYAKTPRFFE